MSDLQGREAMANERLAKFEATNPHIGHASYVAAAWLVLEIAALTDAVKAHSPFTVRHDVVDVESQL